LVFFSSSVVSCLCIVVLLSGDTTSAQHCGFLNSSSFHPDDLCYPFWKQLTRDEHSNRPFATAGTYPPSSGGLIYLTSSLNSSQDALKLSRERSEGLKLFSSECREAAAALSCAGALLPCEYVSLQTKSSSANVPWPSIVPVPRPPCNSVCRRMAQQCEGVKELSIPDCDEVDPSTGKNQEKKPVKSSY